MTQATLANDVRQWDVYRDNDVVAWVADKPGAITIGACTLGQKGKAHPFLTASWINVLYERDFERLLAESKDTDHFLKRLEWAGFRVKQTGEAR